MVIKGPPRTVSVEKVFGLLVRLDPANEGVAWAHARHRLNAMSWSFTEAVEEGVSLGVLEVFDVPSKTRPARGIRRIIPVQSSGGAA